MCACGVCMWCGECVWSVCVAQQRGFFEPMSCHSATPDPRPSSPRFIQSINTSWSSLLVSHSISSPASTSPLSPEALGFGFPSKGKGLQSQSHRFWFLLTWRLAFLLSPNTTCPPLLSGNINGKEAVLLGTESVMLGWLHLQLILQGV